MDTNQWAISITSAVASGGTISAVVAALTYRSNKQKTRAETEKLKLEIAKLEAEQNRSLIAGIGESTAGSFQSAFNLDWDSDANPYCPACHTRVIGTSESASRARCKKCNEHILVIDENGTRCDFTYALRMMKTKSNARQHGLRTG